MKNQRNLILRNIVLLVLGGFCLAVLGFLVGNHHIWSEVHRWMQNDAFVNWLQEPRGNFLHTLIRWVFAFCNYFFWWGYGALFCCLILNLILIPILLSSALFLLHREHPNARKSGRGSLWGVLQGNRIMSCIGFSWALLGTLLPYLSAAWGILIIALFAAGVYLLWLAVRMYQRLLLLLEKEWEENRNAAPELEAQKRQELGSRKLFVRLFFLSGLLLGLSLFLGSRGDLILTFSERLERMTGEMTGGGIFVIPFAILFIFVDLVVSFPAMYGFPLLMPVAVILTIVFTVSSNGDGPKKGRGFARGILILETIPAAPLAILIAAGLFDKYQPVFLKIGISLLYLAGFVLLLRGYWILPELPPKGPASGNETN